MKYLLTWTVKPEDQQESIKRWKNTGPNPPAGIELISHYWSVNLLKGWAVFSASDNTLIAKWLKDWTDLNANEVTPIIEDDELHSIVG